MLNETQREFLRDSMTRQLDELRSLIGDEVRVEEDGRSSSADVGDFGDEAVDADLVRTEKALVGLHREEVRELAAALRRLAGDSYGRCIDCQAPIGFERLKANPTGTRCQPCQKKFETAGAGPGRMPR
jgi:RNA polymerase-binding transcription factor DksA